MIEASLVLFAIQAGVKLGQQTYQIIVDKDFDRALTMPNIKYIDNTAENEAQEFFEKKENRDWIKPGGQFRELYQNGEYLKAYQALKGIDRELDGKADKVLPGIQRFEQIKKDPHTPKTTVRLLNTVVDIGIDFFKTNMDALCLSSNAQKVITAFVPAAEKINDELNLDEKEFDKRKIPDIAGKVLTAGLQVLGDNRALLSRDQGVQNLLGGVALALAEDFKDVEFKSDRLEFYDRVTSSLLRGAMAGFSENPTLFIKGKSGEADFIRDTLTQVFQGLQTQEDLFTTESLEVIYKHALLAVSESAPHITDNQIIQSFLKRTVDELIIKEGTKEIFSEGTVAEIMKIGLETLGNNISTLIDPDNPERKLLDETVAALAFSLSSALAGDKLGALFTSKQMIALSQIVFQEVAKNPEVLLGFKEMNLETTGLAQIIGSVAQSLEKNPRKLITGEGALELVRTAIKTAAQNAGTLLRLDTADPTENLLYQLLNATVHPLAEKITTENLPGLINRQTIAETATRVLVTTVNNLEPFIQGEPTQISDLIKAILRLATEEKISARLNAGNFALVFDKLLRKLLLGELVLTDENSIRTALIAALTSLL